MKTADEIREHQLNLMRKELDKLYPTLESEIEIACIKNETYVKFGFKTGDYTNRLFKTLGFIVCTYKESEEDYLERTLISWEYKI
jgi:hypothetical protein